MDLQLKLVEMQMMVLNVKHGVLFETNNVFFLRIVIKFKSFFHFFFENI